MTKRKYAIRDTLITDIGSSIDEMQAFAGKLDYRVVPLKAIEPDPDQPRELRFIDHAQLPKLPEIDADDPALEIKRQRLDGLIELANSIREKGVMESIEVYPVGKKFRIVYGERRFLASILAKQTHIPAKVLPKRPEDLRERQAIENLQREDLTLSETLANVRSVREEYEQRTGRPMNQAEYCRRTGFSKGHASLQFQLLNAPDDVRAAIAQGELTDMRKASLLAKIPNAADRGAQLRQVLAGIDREELNRAVQKTTTPAKRAGRSAGRPAAAVRFGSTSKPERVRELVLKTVGKRRFASQYADIDWRDARSATAGWRRFWDWFEQTP